MQEQTAGNLLNSDRARYGLAPLAVDPALCRIARIKSQDMRDHQYFAHTSPTYGDVHSMLIRFGYDFAAAGENIAHHASVEKAQAAFLSSPGHRRNIMSTAYTKVGLGVAIGAKGDVYLTQIFVR
ncbi:MAG: CAP domain-containing protein [Candidatus Ventricola sp.]